MVPLNIAAKIWLSIGIFILGFIAFAALSQVHAMRTEDRLETLARFLYPAALAGRTIENGFEEAIQNFGEAAVMRERSSLERGVEQARRAAEGLRELAELRGLTPDRRAQAIRTAAAVEQFLALARWTDAAVLANPGISAQTRREMRELAVRANAIRGSLAVLRGALTADLEQQLQAERTRSARLRWFGLWVFASTLPISAILVNRTIRRAITAPLLRAETELAHERDLLRILLDNVPDYIFFKDAEGKFIRVNKAQARLLGIEDEKEAPGRSEADFLDPEYARQARQDEQEVVRTGSTLVSKVERVNAAGLARWVTSTKVPVKDDQGRVCGVVCVSRDITDWKEAVESLQKSEESFRLLFKAIPHAAWVYDAETLEFLEVNEAALRHYGYSVEEFRRLPILSLHAPEEQARLREALRAPDPAPRLSGAWKHQTRSGQMLDVEVGAQVFLFRGRRAVMAVVQDVTQRKRLEAELHQAQRLESVGQLAAGIAHEINTPIQYVGDNVRFLRDAFEGERAVLAQYEALRQAAAAGAVDTALLGQLARALADADIEYLSEEVPRAIAQSLDGVERVASIVRAMKEFAHPGHKDKAAADLNKALSNALIVARNEFKYVADAETDFGPLPPVVCHIAEINQVFLNLLVNAAHAIAEVVKGTPARGKITVRTWQNGDQAMIAISDTGCGIPPAIRDKVFDPFFTTKPVGRGTGQGLAIARSIVVEKHGGTLTFAPNGSQGTTFLISLPVQPQPNPALDPAGAAAGE